MKITTVHCTVDGNKFITSGGSESSYDDEVTSAPPSPNGALEEFRSRPSRPMGRYGHWEGHGPSPLSKEIFPDDDESCTDNSRDNIPYNDSYNSIQLGDVPIHSFTSGSFERSNDFSEHRYSSSILDGLDDDFETTENPDKSYNSNSGESDPDGSFERELRRISLGHSLSLESLMILDNNQSKVGYDHAMQDITLTDDETDFPKNITSSTFSNEDPRSTYSTSSHTPSESEEYDFLSVTSNTRKGKEPKIDTNNIENFQADHHSVEDTENARFLKFLESLKAMSEDNEFLVWTYNALEEAVSLQDNILQNHTQKTEENEERIGTAPEKNQEVSSSSSSLNLYQ